MNRIKLAPSILSADFSRLGEQVAEITAAGADYIHIDVMDGHFVPNITIGAPVVSAIRPCTNIPLDVHLMVERPESFITEFAKAGADILTVHVETCPHLHRVISEVKSYGLKAGVAINPATTLDTLSEILVSADLILLMTVNPGFGGQAFIPEMMVKIAHLRRELDRNKLKADLEVDGGVTATLAPRLVRAGATILVAGTAIFGAKNGVKKAMLKMRQAAASGGGTL